MRIEKERNRFAKARVSDKYKKFFKENHHVYGDIKSIRIDSRKIAYRLDKNYANNNEV